MGAVLTALKGVFDPNEKIIRRVAKVAEQINALESKMQALADDDFPVKTAELTARCAAGESLDDLLPESFALTREAARRVLGERAHDVQLMGGAILHEVKIADEDR